MKLAYFSPMPPAKTGVATYSRQLVEALAPLCEITVFTPTPGALGMEGVPMRDFGACPAAVAEALGSQVLYHLGNNPWFHLEIWKALCVMPGPVCLHDTVLYYLAAGLGRGHLLQEVFAQDPHAAFRNLDGILAECPEGDLLRYPHPSRHPAIRGLLEIAPQIIVHNHTSARALAELGYRGRLDVIPHLHYAEQFPPIGREEASELRRSLGFDERDFVVGAFGFIGPTKRIDRVLQALARVRARSTDREVKLLVVGEGGSFDAKVAELGLEAAIHAVGFVSDEEFRRYLMAIDLLANLRYPSHGESSGSLVQAMSYGKVCLVTDHASFGEMPDEAVVKVPYDDTEVDVLEERILALMQDDALHIKIATAARDHIAGAHAPGAVARRFVSALGGARSATRSSPAFDPSAYMRGRVEFLSDPATS